MGERVEEIEKVIVGCFPKLEHDTLFKVTSKATPKYNCIAWAYKIDNRWMWPNTGEYEFLDGIHFWPDKEIRSCDVSNFIAVFEQLGYERCDNGEMEQGHRKIALYVVPNTTTCTHAARQLASGCWTSKLGKSQDIQHGSAETIEGVAYGEVYCYMKQKFE